MTDEIIPQLDQRDTPWVEMAMNHEGEAEAFVDENPDYYATGKNTKRILHWLALHDNAPVTRRNLAIAYRECLKAGILELRPVEAKPTPESPRASRGVTRIESTIRLPYTVENNEANRKALDQPLSELRAMSRGIGKPVDENLKRAYRQSLAKARQANYTPVQINAAKAHIGLNHPEVKRESPAFSRLVAEFLANGN